MTNQNQPQALCPNNGQPCENTQCACPATPTPATLNSLDNESSLGCKDCSCACKTSSVAQQAV